MKYILCTCTCIFKVSLDFDYKIKLVAINFIDFIDISNKCVGIVYTYTVLLLKLKSFLIPLKNQEMPLSFFEIWPKKRRKSG